MYDKQHVVKRKGHKEYFDIRKLYASIYSACMTLRISRQEAELLAEMVSAEIEEYISGIEQLTSQQIRELAYKELEKYHPDAAYMYISHRDIM